MLRLLAAQRVAICFALPILFGCGSSTADGSPGAALSETLQLVATEFSDLELSEYVSLVASNGSIRRSVKCADSENTFGANVSSPTTADGTVIRVDHLKQTWFISPGCYDQMTYGHFAGEFSMLTTLDDESGKAQLTGWIETKSSGKCNFDLSVTFESNSGKSMSILGKLCNESVDELTIPVFLD